MCDYMGELIASYETDDELEYIARCVCQRRTYGQSGAGVALLRVSPWTCLEGKGGVKSMDSGYEIGGRMPDGRLKIAWQ